MAAVTLRDEGFDGRIVLIGAEDHPPYERPPLSKEYLRGEVPFENASVRSPGFYGENGIEARLGTRVALVEPSEHVVELEDGERVAYDKLLIATGAKNRRLAVTGVDLEAVYTCARSRTPTASARRPSRGGRRSWSAWALSARRSRPRCGSSASR